MQLIQLSHLNIIIKQLIYYGTAHTVKRPYKHEKLNIRSRIALLKVKVLSYSYQLY